MLACGSEPASVAYTSAIGQANIVGGPFNDLTVIKGNLTLAGTLKGKKCARKYIVLTRVPPLFRRTALYSVDT